jgi:hypothetical protein
VDLSELRDFERPAVSEERFRTALTSADGEDALAYFERSHWPGRTRRRHG